MATYYVDFSGSATGDESGDSWANAMDLAAFKTYYEGTPTAGDIIYCMASGTLTADITGQTSADGTATAPFSIVGVKPTTDNEPPVYADWATGTDRPKLTCGAYYFGVGDYTKVYNVRITSTDTWTTIGGQYSVYYNCDAEQTSSTTSTRHCFYAAYSGVSIINCFAERTNWTSGTSNGVYIASGCKVINSYMKGGATGIYGNASYAVVLNNIFNNMSLGTSSVDGDFWTIVGNTFFDVDEAIDAASTYGSVIFNNVWEDCDTVGMNWTTQTDSNFVAFNNGYDGTATTFASFSTNVATDLPHTDFIFSNNPALFTAEGSNDFTLLASSTLRQAGMPLYHGVG